MRHAGNGVKGQMKLLADEQSYWPRAMANISYFYVYQQRLTVHLLALNHFSLLKLSPWYIYVEIKPRPWEFSSQIKEIHAHVCVCLRMCVLAKYARFRGICAWVFFRRQQQCVVFIRSMPTVFPKHELRSESRKPACNSILHTLLPLLFLLLLSLLLLLLLLL